MDKRINGFAGVGDDIVDGGAVCGGHIWFLLILVAVIAVMMEKVRLCEMFLDLIFNMWLLNDLEGSEEQVFTQLYTFIWGGILFDLVSLLVFGVIY